MLMPKKTKYRKMQRGRRKGISKGARTLAFGQYGLQALVPVWLTAQQIEAMRVTLSRNMKKLGSFYLRVFPDKPITKLPAETRMGKGKGGVEGWVAVVKRERMICEVAGVTEVEAREILQQVSYKLPMKTRFIKKEAVAAAVEKVVLG